MLSNPIILITSSTKSISPNISGLQVGTFTEKIFPFFFKLKPSFVKIFKIWFDLTFIPIVLVTMPGSKLISNDLNFLFCWISNLETSPPQILVIRSAAASRPDSIELGSIPLSNLNLASLFKSKFLAVFLVISGSK